MLAAPNVSALFTPGHTFTLSNGWQCEISISEPVGLALTSGRVVACDPFVGLDPEDCGPFTAWVAPGSYPVTLAVVTITDPGQPAPDKPHQRVAAARLGILDAPVASWELALLEGQDLRELEGEEFFGYGVDAGTGCFVDGDAVGPMAAYEADTDALDDALDAIGSGADAVKVTAPGGHEIVAFSSGWGDGAYPTWVGRTGDGHVACFVTEFAVVPVERLG